MANITSAKKRARQSEKRRVQNQKKKAAIRTFEKKVRSSLILNKKEEANVHYKTFTSLIDKASKKNIVHANKASRKKSRLALLIMKSDTRTESKSVPSSLA